jgi:GNAT superfamily N-acetyltransferase
MITIDTYRGSSRELADFVTSVWSHSYAGKMTFPRWTEEFFDWQFRLATDSERLNLIAAYDGSRLAGVLLGTDYSFRTLAEVFGGSQWSWLSIDPGYRGQGISRALDQERIRRMTASGSRLIVSYRYFGSVHSKAERPRAGVNDQKFNRKIGFWARVIDANRFASWHWNAIEGWLAKLAAPFTGIPTRAMNNPSIRPYDVSDLEACLRLAREANGSTKLSIDWDRTTLQHQLNGHPISQTLVSTEKDQIEGFINFHVLPFQARRVENVAVIDMIVCGRMPSRRRVDLLNAALARMQQQNVVLALKLRCGDSPAWPLVRTHFVPKLPDSHLVLQAVTQPLKIPTTGSLHLLWR